MIEFALAKESLGYQTSTDPSNTDKRLLIAGSQNVLVDQQKKVSTRPGYTRLGVANTALTPILNAWRWDASTGSSLTQRNYNGNLQVYVTTVDGVAINAWTQISAIFSTTKKIRPALSHVTSGGGWFDTTENIDVQVMANGDANLYEWSGGISVAASSTINTLTKTGTKTWAQNRFYTTRNKGFVNARTGVAYTYGGGEGTLTLTGVAPDPTGDIVAGDVLVQSIVTQSNKPASTHTNDIIFVFLNQIVVGSKVDGLTYLSKITSYIDFAYSTPRVAGEGGLLTLDGPTRAINALGTYLLVFAGQSSIFRANYTQVTVSTTLAETLDVQKFDLGINQGALNHESVVAVGNQLAYLTNDVSLRTIDDVQNLSGVDPKHLSNPVKPDFDAETWDPENTWGTWYKNVLFYTAGATSHTYMLNFDEDANGRTQRYWNPPQILPIGAVTTIDLGDGRGPLLYGHSNSVPESYLLFNGYSDGQYANMDPADKIAIHALARYAYDNAGKSADLKNFDEYNVKGEISPNTKDLVMGLDYDFDGYTQIVQRTIDGTDEDILQGSVTNNSLAQSLLAQQPLGGLLTPPADARRFQVIFEIAKEDYFEVSAQFETNEVDRFWSIIEHGPNVQLSRRKPIHIKK